jgi:hypothetical protein
MVARRIENERIGALLSAKEVPPTIAHCRGWRGGWIY